MVTGAEILIFYFMIFITLFISMFFLMTFLELRRKPKMKLKKTPKITFVIPAYNAANYLKESIGSVMKLDYPKNKVRVIIVDDGSTDNTLNVAKALSKRHKQIKVFHKKNEGKASALNYGVKRVKTELTALLDADTILQRDILKKAIPYLQDKKTMTVMCRLVPSNKRGFLANVQEVEYAIVGFCRKLLSSISVLTVAPAFSIYKTKFFHKYGYFDKDNLTEDFEMALRVQSHNYDIGCVIDSYASTAVPTKFNQLKRQRVRWNYGTFYNLYKYKRLFAPKYGDLGIFVLPSQVLIVAATVSIFCLTLYQIVNTASRFIEMLSAGWKPQLELSLFNISLFFSDPRVVFTIIGLTISVFFFVLVRMYTNKKIKFLNFFIYSFGYVWLTISFYIIAMFRLIIKKPSW